MLIFTVNGEMYSIAVTWQGVFTLVLWLWNCDCLKVFAWVFMVWPCGTITLLVPLINFGQHMWRNHVYQICQYFKRIQNDDNAPLPLQSRLARFYRTMHFSAKRGLAIACRLSVCNVGGSRQHTLEILSTYTEGNMGKFGGDYSWGGKKWRSGAQKRQYLWNA